MTYSILKYLTSILEKFNLKLHINDANDKYYLTLISQYLNIDENKIICTWESLNSFLFTGNKYTEYYSIVGLNKNIFDLSKEMFSIVNNKHVNLQFYSPAMNIAICRLSEVWPSIKYIKGDCLEEIRLKMDLIGI